MSNNKLPWGLHIQDGNGLMPLLVLACMKLNQVRQTGLQLINITRRFETQGTH